MATTSQSLGYELTNTSSSLDGISTNALLSFDNSTDQTAFSNFLTTTGDVITDLTYTGSASASARVCALYALISRGYLVGCVTVLGTLGNCLSAYTVWPRVGTHPVSILIFSLAVFDTASLWSALLNMVIPALEGYYLPGGAWRRWVMPCTYAYYRPVGRIGHYAGTWTIIIITFHRYIAVCHPGEMRRWCSAAKTKIQMAVLAVICIIYCVPSFLQFWVTTRPNGAGLVNVKTAIGREAFWFDMFYETILYFTLIYVIPFPCLLAMTCLLLRALKAAKARRQAMTSSESRDYELTRTLVAVVIFFMTCHIFNPVRRGLLALLPPEMRGCGQFYYYFHPFSTAMMMLNAAVNFIIYCLFSPRFRLVFMARMRALICVAPKVHPVGENNGPSGGHIALGPSTNQPTGSIRLLVK